ncbi:MAG: hypothetical protein R2932_09530 [Caldilineaceae bacterium]
MSFEINLPRIEPFDFFVDAYGLPSGEIVAAVQQGTTMPPFELTISEHSLADMAAETIYLPLVNR